MRRYRRLCGAFVEGGCIDEVLDGGENAGEHEWGVIFEWMPQPVFCVLANRHKAITQNSACGAMPGSG